MSSRDPFPFLILMNSFSGATRIPRIHKLFNYH
jgi:hypothetical protein